jgi:hypothetical protein
MQHATDTSVLHGRREESLQCRQFSKLRLSRSGARSRPAIASLKTLSFAPKCGSLTTPCHLPEVYFFALGDADERFVVSFGNIESGSSLLFVDINAHRSREKIAF